MGWKFLDEEGREFVPTGGTLCKIKNIKPPEKPLGAEVTTLCDVTNPLFGKNGAAHVYAAQKGATESEIEELDRNTVHFNEICKTQGKDLSQIAGGGAAGGLGAGSVFSSVQNSKAARKVSLLSPILKKKYPFATL